MLLNNEWVNNEIKEDIKKFLETNENEHTTAKNVWDTAKAVLTEKLIAIQAYFKNIETLQKHKLTLHLQEREEKTTNKPRESTTKEIIKIREELNDIETKNNSKDQ